MIGEFILQNLEKLCYVRYIPTRFLVDLKHQFSRWLLNLQIITILYYVWVIWLVQDTNSLETWNISNNRVGGFIYHRGAGQGKIIYKFDNTSFISIIIFYTNILKHIWNYCWKNSFNLLYLYTFSYQFIPTAAKIRVSKVIVVLSPL